jgi:protein TonB
MSALALSHEERRTWGAAGAGAFAAHAALAFLVLGLARPVDPPVPDPVVLVDLPPPPPSAVAATDAVPPSSEQPHPITPSTPLTPLPALPDSRLPLPSDTTTLPRTEPQRSESSATPQQPSQPSAQPSRPESGAGPQTGFDPAAQKAEADYKALVGGHIRRNRFSPPQSKKAGLSGDVKLRFVVDRKGGISGVSVAGSSGHSLLDSEAMQFIQRLSPVPAFPRDLKKADIPLTITLKFDLERK